MKLHAFADAFNEQLHSSHFAELSFEERLGLLVDTEHTARENRRLSRRLRAAKLRYPASLENIDFKTPRRLNRQQTMTLSTCAWLTEQHNLIVSGPTGIGKSFIACALVERACRRGFNAFYIRAPGLIDQLAVSRIDGSYPRLLSRLAKLHLLAIDDWLIAPLKDTERQLLMEIIEERAERGSTLLATQLPIKDWHASIADPNHAAAICDRLLHNAHRIEMKGHSMRKTKSAPKTNKEDTHTIHAQ